MAMTDEQVEHLLARLHIIILEQRRSCPTCLQFDPPSEGCLNAGGARPPAKVIAEGCRAWEPDIPF